MPFQYANEANPRAHYEGTGAEIAEALDRVDVLVAGLGTGGTLMGAGERVRESFPDVVVAAAEPLPGDPVMGLRSLEDGYVPPILDVAKARPEAARLERGVGRRPARARRPGGRSSPGSPPVRSSTSPGGSPRSSTRASSSASSPTAAGSTSPPTSGTRSTPTRRWSTATGGSARPRSGASWSGTPTRRRRTRPAACSRSATGVAERYIPCVNTAASPYRFDLRVPDPELIFELEDARLRARRLPLAPDRLGPAVARPTREHRPLGGPAVPDPLAADRRALRVDDSRGSGRAAPPRFPGRPLGHLEVAEHRALVRLAVVLVGAAS